MRIAIITSSPFVQAGEQLRGVYGLAHSGIQAADQGVPKGPLPVVGDEAVAPARLTQVGNDHRLRQQARADIAPQTKSGTVQTCLLYTSDAADE